MGSQCRSRKRVVSDKVKLLLLFLWWWELLIDLSVLGGQIMKEQENVAVEWMEGQWWRRENMW